MLRIATLYPPADECHDQAAARVTRPAARDAYIRLAISQYGMAQRWERKHHRQKQPAPKAGER